LLVPTFERILGNNWKKQFQAMLQDWKQALETKYSDLPYEEKSIVIKRIFDNKYTVEQRALFNLSLRILQAIYMLYFGSQMMPDTIHKGEFLKYYREFNNRIETTFNKFIKQQ
jgi:hypothetical protein